jgi:ComF family protein
MINSTALPFFKESLRTFLEPFVPPLCPLCHDPIDTDESLCAGCWKTIDFISDPRCSVCSLPLECGERGPLICGPCLKDPPPFSATQAACRYTPASRALVLQLKYADATHLVPLFAKWMTRDSRIFECVDAIIPVPLHWTRLLSRGFNQAGLLANAISKETHLPFWPHILKRPKKTAPQGSLSKEDRHAALKRAFRVDQKFKSHVQGKILMLIDDVMASSATVKFSTKALLTAGAKEVRVNVLCRS